MSNVDFWNQRAQLGEQAGTQDLIAAELERRAIARHIQDGMRVLDVGCGTGGTALWLARRYNVEVVGIDSAHEMIRQAKIALCNQTEPVQPESRVWFEEADVLRAEWGRPFDLIYTQRLIVNLKSWDEQRAAIERILAWLKPGGTLLLVECSQDGLDDLNALRKRLGLPAIKPPKWNRYLRDAEMDELSDDLTGQGRIVAPWDPEAICSTYALLSRLVNARLAADVGQEPAYDSPINQVALDLPNVGDFGQNRMWEWRKGE